MKLSDHLEERFVTLELKSRDKDQAIRELAETLRESADMSDFETYVRDVFEREKQASTGIGRGAAIPHARTDAVKDFVVAVGRAPEGIDFGSIDGKPVRVIILMGTPKAKVKTYLKLLAHLSHLIKTNGFLDGLISAADAAAVVGLFQSHEH